ncbi:MULTISPECIES: hypothetical protein [Gammaproteobacteria]|uniref:hypothetical protein n=1 Tax=Gammaproteobacteria TaxID=1236 RepID=UPI000DCFBDF6|nr:MULTISPECIES: hypothetical protein [Gammaproteobacteria]RTE86730.1 hypothetical protein DQX04_09285 [Aliidiomarina sp. B3213]TCZ90716.1 hypothetical protein EYQ95_07760 [Lysobacter sp. N42]
MRSLILGVMFCVAMPSMAQVVSPEPLPPMTPMQGPAVPSAQHTNGTEYELIEIFKVLELEDVPDSEEGLLQYWNENVYKASPDAAYDLGKYYLDRSEFSQAIFHFMLAKRFHSDLAQEALDQILPQLTEQQISQFEQFVEQFIEHDLILPVINVNQETTINFESRERHEIRDYGGGTRGGVGRGQFEMPVDYNRNDYFLNLRVTLLISPRGRVVDFWTQEGYDSEFMHNLEDMVRDFRFHDSENYTVHRLLMYGSYEQNYISEVARRNIESHFGVAKSGNRESQYLIYEALEVHSRAKYWGAEGSELLDVFENDLGSHQLYWLERAARQGSVNAEIGLALFWYQPLWLDYLLINGSDENQRRAAITLALNVGDEELRDKGVVKLEAILEQNPDDELVEDILQTLAAQA